MRVSATILIFILFSGFIALGGGKNAEGDITWDFKKDLELLLPNGTHTVDIMDIITMSKRREELTQKMVEGQRKNYEWYMQQMTIAAETGNAVPYDPRLGVTETEWAELLVLFSDISDMKANSSGTEEVEVIRNGDVISFKSAGKLSSLNSTTIDVNSMEVTVDGYSLLLQDTINIRDSVHVFKSPWRGYKFGYSTGNSTLPSTPEELQKVSFIQYGITLGLMEKTGKTYLVILGREMVNGQLTRSYEIPIVFK